MPPSARGRSQRQRSRPAPASYLRRFGIPATLGAGVIWSFPQGLIIPSGPAELVVWNIGAATSTFSGYFSYDE